MERNESLREETEKELEYFGVYYALGAAFDALCKVSGKLADAEKRTEGFPAYGDRIASMSGEVDRLQDEIEKMRGRLMKEVRSA